ncbi:MAG: hypothetical protein EB032_13990, partial [Betaproteobacteria bacterium]|nr:hypothetical protein [Betaproteobacteria bacterium]
MGKGAARQTHLQQKAAHQTKGSAQHMTSSCLGGTGPMEEIHEVSCAVGGCSLLECNDFATHSNTLLSFLHEPMSQGGMRASEQVSPPEMTDDGTIAAVLNFTFQTNTMRIAAFFYKDQPHVGLVSQDLNSVTPFDLPLADRELGALTLVDALSRGEALPPQGAAIALKDVQLR